MSVPPTAGSAGAAADWLSEASPEQQLAFKTPDVDAPDWPNQAMCIWEKLECHTWAPPELQLTPGFCLVKFVTSQGQELCCYGAPVLLCLCDQHFHHSWDLPLQKLPAKVEAELLYLPGLLLLGALWP